MRFIIPAAAALALLAVQAHAQTTTTPDATVPATPAPAAPATPAPAAPATAAPASPAAPTKMKHTTSHHRQTLQQHFDKVNTTHDGHLTKDQAVAGKWSYVTKNFDAMDKTHKGYVTVEDIHAFAKARHATSHKKTTTPPATTTAPATSG